MGGQWYFAMWCDDVTDWLAENLSKSMTLTLQATFWLVRSTKFTITFSNLHTFEYYNRCFNASELGQFVTSMTPIVSLSNEQNGGRGCISTKKCHTANIFNINILIFASVTINLYIGDFREGTKKLTKGKI